MKPPTFLTLIALTLLSSQSISRSTPEDQFDKIFNAYFDRVFEYHKNDTALEFKDEVACIKLELSKMNSQTELLSGFNREEVSEDRCIETLRLFNEWKSEEFTDDFSDCKGADLPNEAIYRHIIVVLEKTTGKMLDEERENYKSALQDTVVALINCEAK